MLTPVTPEALRGGLEVRFSVGDVEPLNPDLPLIVGDAFHNLRAALDYLVFQLHVRRFRGKVPPSAVKASAFPVKSQPSLTSQWNEIKRLGDHDRRAIAWLQLYNARGDQTDQLRKTVRDVHLLNIIDKHRALHLTSAVPASVYRPPFEPQVGFRGDAAFGVPLEPGTVVDTWTFDSVPPAAMIYGHPGIYRSVQIDVAGDRIAVVEHLGGCILGVGMILDRFANRFATRAEPPDLSWVRRTDG